MIKEAPCLKKSLGQHFLVNAGIAWKIVDLLEIDSRDQILEIGPGGGSLTSLLAHSNPACLALIEKDQYWAEFHRQKGLELIGTDALAFGWQTLGRHGIWKLVGNLPYNIASPLIWDIVASCDCYERAIFMTQKEVAERICAAPGCRAYGALSVWVQAHAKVKFEFTVNPGSFRPPPRVDSAVVTFKPQLSRPEHPDALKRLLQICFQQRRKQLGGIFRRMGLGCLEQALNQLGIDGSQRPENLDLAQFLELSQKLAQCSDN